MMNNIFYTLKLFEINMKIKKSYLIIIIFLFLLLPSYSVSSEIIESYEQTSDYIIFVDNDYTNNTEGWNITCFNKIQDAIDVANENSTIFVYEGEYFENIILNKSVLLDSKDKNNTIINGNNTIFAVRILSSNIIFKNFTIKNAKIGIYINGTGKYYGNIIEKNIIINNSNGIYLSNSSNNTIFDNVLKNNSEGIQLYISSKNNISKNVIVNNKAGGIDLWEKSTDNIISNNLIFDNEKGIFFGRWSNSNIIINNNISNSSEGFYLDYSFTNQFLKNNISNNDLGFYLYNSNGNNATDNIISNNNYGFYLFDSDDNDMINNSFSDNGEDIRLGGSPPVIKTPGFVLLIFVFAVITLIFYRRR